MNRILLCSAFALLWLERLPTPLIAQEPADAVLERAAAPPATNGSGETESRRSRHATRSNKCLVTVFNDAVVKEDETVREVVVVGGSVEVQGTVQEDLVVVFGSVKLGPKASIKGDLVVVGSGLQADPGATVGHHRVLVGAGGEFAGIKWHGWPQQWFRKGLLWARPLPHQYWWAWAVAGAALFLYLIIALLFPRPVGAAVAALEDKPGRSLLLGLLASLLFGPLLLLLFITVIGVVAVPFVICATMAAFLFGKVAVYSWAGGQVGSQAGLALLKNPIVALIVGALLFYLLYVIPVIGLLAWGVVAPLGMGAALLAFFRRKKTKLIEQSAAIDAPLSPPPPDSPGPIFGAPPAAPSTLLPRIGFWWRLFATALDLVLVGVIIQLFRIPQWFLPIWIAYHLALWSWHGATIGDLVLGLRLVRKDGAPLSFSVALVRLMATFFSFVALFLGFFWAGWDREKQAWHDKIAGTIVVRSPRETVLA